MKISAAVHLMNLIQKASKLRGAMVFTTLILLAFVTYHWPHRGELVLFKLSLVTLAGMLGYMIDVLLFPKHRIHELHDNVQNGEGEPWQHQLLVASQIRRSIIVLASILGICLGL